MKKTSIGLSLLSLAIFATFAFKNIGTSSIKGTVSPAEGATAAWAVSGKDTLKSVIANGNFDITVDKLGTYTLIIDAMPPYKDAIKDGIIVEEGQPSDVGVIVLEK